EPNRRHSAHQVARSSAARSPCVAKTALGLLIPSLSGRLLGDDSSDLNGRTLSWLRANTFACDERLGEGTVGAASSLPVIRIELPFPTASRNFRDPVIVALDADRHFGQA